MDFPLAIFLPHALIAWQAGLLPGGELVAAGRSDAEQLVSLEMPSPEEKGQRGSGSLRWKFTAWCHLKLLQGSKLWVPFLGPQERKSSLPGGNYTTTCFANPRPRGVCLALRAQTPQGTVVSSAVSFPSTPSPRFLHTNSTSQSCSCCPAPSPYAPGPHNQDLCYRFPPSSHQGPSRHLHARVLGSALQP